MAEQTLKYFRSFHINLTKGVYTIYIYMYVCEGFLGVYLLNPAKMPFDVRLFIFFLPKTINSQGEGVILKNVRP